MIADDENVTSFYELVTPRCSIATGVRVSSVNDGGGRGEGAGTRRPTVGPGCRRYAGFDVRSALVAGLILGLSWAPAGCGGQRRTPPAGAADATALASVTADRTAGEAGDMAHSGADLDEVFFAAYLDEVVRNRPGSARDGYAKVAGGPGAPPALVARASLRLASLEAASGNRARAGELATRAVALARDDDELLERADRVRARVAAPSQVGPRRGPPVGMRLEGASADAARAFARAEKALEAYYRRPLEPRLEGLQRTLRANQAALDNVVRSYRAAARLDPVVAVAAQFRIGSVFHDSALAMFDVPPELEPEVAARLRATLRQRALGYLDRARAAYLNVLEAWNALPEDGRRQTKRWRGAAETGLAGVERLKRF